MAPLTTRPNPGNRRVVPPIPHTENFAELITAINDRLRGLDAVAVPSAGQSSRRSMWRIFSSPAMASWLRSAGQKTDQEGEGRKVGIPYGSNPETCPVRAMRAWLEGTAIESGPVFRTVTRHGKVGARMSGYAVALVVKRYAGVLGLLSRDYCPLSSGSAARNSAWERSRSVITEHDNSTAVHFAFLRTLNSRVSAVDRSSFAGGFFSLKAGNLEGSDLGGFFSTGGWVSLAWRANSCLMCWLKSLFDIVAGLGGGSGIGGFFLVGLPGFR
jgi:hypothetical protein